VIAIANEFAPLFREIVEDKEERVRDHLDWLSLVDDLEEEEDRQWQVRECEHMLTCITRLLEMLDRVM
jgi:hypothetical protein